jgi:hypothetical protein
MMPPIPVLPIEIAVGSPMKFTVTFFDHNNVAFDPVSDIQITAINPAGVHQVLTYPTNLIREGVGIYSVVVEATTKGLWSGFGSGKLPNGMTVTTERGYQRAV